MSPQSWAVPPEMMFQRQSSSSRNPGPRPRFAQAARHVKFLLGLGQQKEVVDEPVPPLPNPWGLPIRAGQWGKEADAHPHTATSRGEGPRPPRAEHSVGHGSRAPCLQPFWIGTGSPRSSIHLGNKRFPLIVFMNACATAGLVLCARTPKISRSRMDSKASGMSARTWASALQPRNEPSTQSHLGMRWVSY